MYDNCMQHPNRIRAFSLVELSIVLVILGLLTGGILAGQSLIRAAQLRAVSTEYMRYKTAVGSFRDKYFALPGDMANATSFWGTAGTCPGTSASPSTSAATCNGNGDFTLDPTVSTGNEYYRFWQHLANAGLIEGSYSGVANSTTASAALSLPGTNVPTSKLTGAGWSVYNYGNPGVASTLTFEGNYGNSFSFGATNLSTITDGPILKPEEAWNIDTKMDDGKPGTGGVRTYEAYGSSCSDTAASTTVAIAATSAYLLSNSSLACNLIFNMM